MNFLVILGIFMFLLYTHRYIYHENKQMYDKVNKINGVMSAVNMYMNGELDICKEQLQKNL